MPWTLKRYPLAMTHLPEPVRAKAVSISNALLAQGMEEGKAIRIAISTAHRWAGTHPAAERQGSHPLHVA